MGDRWDDLLDSLRTWADYTATCLSADSTSRAADKLITEAADAIADLSAERDALAADLNMARATLREMWEYDTNPAARGAWIESFWNGNPLAIALATALEGTDE
jgi:hypothetical protein